ncbi:hypothetical protein WA158_002657 [Blastocystis sp. Blastoise]
MLKKNIFLNNVLLNIKYGKSLMHMLPNYIYAVIYGNNELTLVVSTENLTKVLYFLKNHTNCQYKILSDMCGVDYPDRSARFEIVYSLLSIVFNSRIRVKISVSEFDNVNTITSLYSCAGWFEREIYDMFGIYFLNNKDLRRILTDYGFKGFPLRKDFPLLGFKEVRYDDFTKSVRYQDLEYANEYKYSTFNNITHKQIKSNKNINIYIKCDTNNTFVTYKTNKTRIMSIGALGFSGFKKKSFYAAISLGKFIGDELKKQGFTNVNIKIKGIPVKLTGIFKGLIETGIKINNIYDITPKPFNGCKKRKIYF